MQKARTIRPPDTFYSQNTIPDPVVEVDVGRIYYAATGAVVVALASVGVNIWMASHVKRNREHLEAVREYMNRLINNTDCGKEAYDTFYEDDTIDWTEEAPKYSKVNN